MAQFGGLGIQVMCVIGIAVHLQGDAFRHAHAVFRRRQFLSGQDIEGSGLPDVWWFRTDGRKMAARDWDEGTPVVGMFLNGEEIVTHYLLSSDNMNFSFTRDEEITLRSFP